MILKSITLSGFKSFAKKTTIDVSCNVTGIVGPNGSGKSNIAEAIRFVLGEQSMKNIRSKSMSDLIFRGTDNNYLSRASVSIEIDNKNKNYSDSVSPELAKFLTYDDIVLSREVFSDGGSVYKINGGEVRLKDVQTLLALAGIGNSVHTIISQGQADGVLLASPRERREMMEDALGLRVHQIRLKDSERKLKKVEEHMKTINMLRLELAPELSHLRVQMDKINKIEQEREKLLDSYIKYFAYEDADIIKLKQKIHSDFISEDDINITKNKIQELEEREKQIEIQPNQNLKLKQDINENRFKLERELSGIVYEKNVLLNELNREVKDVIIKHSEYNIIKSTLKDIVSNINANDYNNAKIKIDRLFNDFDKYETETVNKESIKIKLELLQMNEKEFLSKIENLNSELNKIDTESDTKYIEIKKILNEKNELERKLREYANKKAHIEYEKQILQEKERDFIYGVEEANRFVGQKVLNYKEYDIQPGYDHMSIRRSIERSKIRIEEIGILDPTSVKMHYEEVSDRDKLLSTELEDLQNTRASLDELIKTLNDTIQNDFRLGLDKINFAFNNYFHDIFSGGKASIFPSVHKIEDEDGEMKEIEDGIDIEVTLPNKKMRDLNMLSGGEKALASIALLFALTSITPPPFMVLDETDAALDEMNAKKYGKLLQHLAKKSRLLVITHNRETMNQCDILYGVTLAGDGSSRLLSIKFD